jgi:cutinase
MRVISGISAVVLAAACLAAAAPAQAVDCPDVELIFARGTSEPAGLGRVGQALSDQLATTMGGRTLGAYGVNYPASYDFLAAADGAADATNRMAAVSQNCPNTRFVLGGYSQGAAVVDMLLGIPPLGEKVGDVGSGSPLPKSLVDRVAAVAVFGNPATKFGNPITFAGRGIDLCNDGDPICSQGRNPFAHTSYEKSPLLREAVGFVSGLL